jgi:DNA-binding response OmpR family regulator
VHSRNRENRNDKILVVDDEQGIVDLLVDGLSDDGFDVISATNGAMALIQIYRDRPDLVVLDLMLPVVNGYEVLRELRGNPTTKNLPIIMLTAISSPEVEKSVRQMRTDFYLTKPWKLDSLLTEIRCALRMGDRGLSAA